MPPSCSQLPAIHSSVTDVLLHEVPPRIIRPKRGRQARKTGQATDNVPSLFFFPTVIRGAGESDGIGRCCLGGAIMIHGLPKGFDSVSSAPQAGDWTDGCIAVTNVEIEEIWRVVPNGTPIEIRQ